MQLDTTVKNKAFGYPNPCVWKSIRKSNTQLKDVRAQKFPRTGFFLTCPARRKVMIHFCQKSKKNRGLPNSFWREHAPKNTLNLKNRASLANKATVSVSPKILQLDL